MAEQTTAARSGGGIFDGFISEISTGLGKAIGTFSSEVLPVFAASRLGLQQTNQLNQDTINTAYLPKKATQTVQGPAIQPAATLNFGASDYLYLGLGVVGLIIVIKLIR